jgi:hypothetical protein
MQTFRQRMDSILVAEDGQIIKPLSPFWGQTGRGSG